MKTRPAYLLAPLALADAPVAPPGDFLLLPYGELPYTKGNERGVLNVDAAFAASVLADFERRGKDLVVDYEHQTLSGKEAPAAGWIDRLALNADGIVAHVKTWTAKAAKYLTDLEYRYHSPVVYGADGRPGLHSVALTNHPALHGLPALVGDDSPPVDLSDIDIIGDAAGKSTQTKPEKKMNEHLKKLAALLGVQVLALADGAEDEAGTAGALLARVGVAAKTEADVKEFLKLHDAADLTAVTGKIAGMVPAADLTALNDRIAGIDAEKAVAQAFTDGKLIEAQRAWALGYAKSNPKGFSDFIAAASKVAPGPAPKQPETPAAKPLALTDDQKSVLTIIGVSPEAVAAAK